MSKKKKRHVIDQGKLYWKDADSPWKKLLDDSPTYTATMTFRGSEPELSISIKGNTITIDYKP